MAIFGSRNSREKLAKKAAKENIDFTWNIIARTAGMDVSRLPNELGDAIVMETLKEQTENGDLYNKYDYCGFYMWNLALACFHVVNQEEGDRILHAFARFIAEHETRMSPDAYRVLKRNLEKTAPKEAKERERQAAERKAAEAKERKAAEAKERERQETERKAAEAKWRERQEAERKAAEAKERERQEAERRAAEAKWRERQEGDRQKDVFDLVCGPIVDIAAAIEEQNSINFRDKNGWTLLHCAVCYGKEDVVTWLLKEGASSKSRTKNGMTPLHLAEHGNIIVELLNYGAESNARTLFGSTPLHHIAINGVDRIASVDPLIEAGGDVEARCRNGMEISDCFWGDGFDDLDPAYALPICFGYNRSSTQIQGGSTPVHWATQGPIMELSLLAKLADSGPSIMDRDEAGNTLLHWAAVGPSHVGNIEWLVANGAEVSATNAVGASPLHLAASRLLPENISHLLELGADPIVQDAYGRTPLHYAVDPSYHTYNALFYESNYLSISRLISSGADVNLKDLDRETPWSLANKNDGLKSSDIYWLLNQSRF